MNFEKIKSKLKKFSIYGAAIAVVLFVILLIFDKLIMPSYVFAPELTVPDMVNMHKDDAVALLKSMNLQPIEEGPRYDGNFEKDHVIFQKPRAGSLVKENRRVYLFISGGEPLVKMPNLVGKTIRDAKITIERLGLVLSEIQDEKSEFPPDLIIEQSIPEGENISKGEEIVLKRSIGPNVAMTRVPDLLGLTLSEAENRLRRYSLKIGKITYLPSQNLLPNTIRDQYPAPDELVSYGDSVNVFVAKGE